MLNEDKKTVRDAPSYWPGGSHAQKGVKEKFGVVEVELMDVHSKNGRVKREFKLRMTNDNDEEPRYVVHIQTLYWPERESVPNDVNGFHHLLKRALHFQEENPELRLLVHCSDGWSKSGLFLAAFNLLQRLEEDDVVHLPWSVLAIRTTHKHFLKDSEQLKCCYELVERHVRKERR